MAQARHVPTGVSPAVATTAARPCFLRDGARVFLTYSATGRGNEPVNGSLGLLDMTPCGRGEAWEDKPGGAARADEPSSTALARY